MTERTDPITKLADVRAPHNIVAAADSMGTARVLIEALEGARIDGAKISLLGAQPTDDPDRAAPGSLDSPGSEISRGAAAGAAAGAGAGALAGLAVGIPGVGTVIAGGLWALFGAAIGGSVGGFGSMGVSKAWKQSFETVRDGNFAVGVHSDDPADIAKAETVMGRLSLLSVNRFDDEEPF